MHDTLELLQSLEFRLVGPGREPNGRDEPAASRCGPICTFDLPDILRLVEARSGDGTVVLGVLGDVELLLQVVKVTPQLSPAGVSLLERKVLPDVLVEHLVDGCVGVDPSAGVAVPIPDAAGAGTPLEDLDGETLLPESVLWSVGNLLFGRVDVHTVRVWR